MTGVPGITTIEYGIGGKPGWTAIAPYYGVEGTSYSITPSGPPTVTSEVMFGDTATILATPNLMSGPIGADFSAADVVTFASVHVIGLAH